MFKSKSSNPILSEKIFGRESSASVADSGTMTVMGTVNKSLILFVLLIVPAIYVWTTIASSSSVELIFRNARTYAMIGGISGFILALVTMFKPQWAAFTAPAYAIFEGLALGSISFVYDFGYNGIALQAIMLTFGVLFVLLMAYRSGLIKATPKFKRGIIIAMGAIAVVYLISFLSSIFGGGSLTSFMFNNGALGIGISLVIVAVAALSLVLDFDFIEQGAAKGAPKYMEWYAAFGLMMTLIWLYLEILRLLALLQGDD